MPTISLIAAIDEENGIGRQKQLLCHLPADLKHFKATTLGKPIIMGRTTFESIGKPLPGRLNIVLTKSLTDTSGITIARSLAEALEQTQDAAEVMIIGGAQLYEQTINMADLLYITLIHHKFGADVFFPAIDNKKWHCSSVEHRVRDLQNSYDMTFETYKRI